jgi:FlaA1/EpsC-like NDP-sugar epimerase
MRSRYSVLDLAALVCAPLLAFILRNDIVLEADGLISLIPYTIATLIVSVPIYVLFGIDKTLWIYATISDYARIIAAVALIVVAATILTFMFDRMSGI